MKSKQIIVSGEVQGVGFRNFTLRAALQLGINGWARNLSNSDVEIFAQAHDGVMEQFIAEIRKGPSRAKVEKVEIIDVDSETVTCDTFSVEPDGEKKRDF